VRANRLEHLLGLEEALSHVREAIQGPQLIHSPAELGGRDLMNDLLCGNFVLLDLVVDDSANDSA
jgi:hypothetical protein